MKATVDGTGPKKGAGAPSCQLPVSGEELKTLQEQHETLSEAWRAAENPPMESKTGYFKQEGVPCTEDGCQPADRSGASRN